MITQWPPETLMAVLRLAMLFGLAQAQGLVLHFLCAGPTMVGEIIAGFVMGPAILDLVPMVEELQTLGQVALMVVLFERGLYTNFSSIAQCGAIGVLMAILSIALSMTLSVVALRMNKIDFMESLCGACILSVSAVGLVDIGWNRRQVKDINPNSSVSSKVIDAGTTICALLAMSVLTVLRNINPDNEWHHPTNQWWSVCQPMLFSLAFMIASFLIRMVFNFFCLKDVMGMFFPPKNDPSSELYNAFEFAQVTFMTGFALAMGVAAEVVHVPAIVGIFVSGLCFGGSETCRESWDRNTRNLSHWLSRVFFTCSIGFMLPKGMGTKIAVLNGWEVASAAFFGSCLGGMIGSLPVLLKEKAPWSNILLSGSAMAYGGEMGFIFLLEFWKAGYISETSLVYILWGLLISAVISPAICQLCIFVQMNTDPEKRNGSKLGAQYQLPEDTGDDGAAGHGSGEDDAPSLDSASKLNGLESKASRMRNTMHYGTPAGGDGEREVPLIYNGQISSSPFQYPTNNGSGSNGYAPYVPSPKEPSPTQAPAGPAGAAARGYGGSAAPHIIRPGLHLPSRSAPPPPPQDRALPSSVQDRGLPPTIEGTYTPSAHVDTRPQNSYSPPNGMYTPNGLTPIAMSASGGLVPMETPNTESRSPFRVVPPPTVPINSQMRRTVPSIWADDD